MSAEKAKNALSVSAYVCDQTSKTVMSAIPVVGAVDPSGTVAVGISAAAAGLQAANYASQGVNAVVPKLTETRPKLA